MPRKPANPNPVSAANAAPANDAAALAQLRAIQAQLPKGVTLADLQRKAQAAQAALGGIAGYMRWLRPGGNFYAQHEPAAHHQVIIEALEAVERGDIRRLMILAPPGSAKSTYVSRMFATWYLLKHPEQLLICASNTESLAVETLNRDRRTICLDPLWIELGAVTGAALDDKASALHHFRTTRGGGIFAAGVGSSITGQRATAGLLLDDPVIDVAHASSATRLSQDFEWYTQVWRQRGTPSSFEIIVSTRWSAQDIPGRLLERQKRGDEEPPWHVLRLPMLADSGDDPMGRVLGEPLWPAWYRDEQIADARRNTTLWLSQYQQTPPNESGTWLGGRDVLRYEDQAPRHLTRFLVADIALSEVSSADWTVVAEVGIDKDRNLWVLDVRRFRASPDHIAEAVAKMHRDHIAELVIDDDNSSKLFKTLLIERARRGARLPAVHLMPLRGRNKEDRAGALRALFSQGRVRILRGDWNADLEYELLTFPSASTTDHDDQVDALSLAARRMTVLSAPSPSGQETPAVRTAFVRSGGVITTGETFEELFESNEPHRGGYNRV
jgi:predicted phage terminase large subunit-like protein